MFSRRQLLVSAMAGAVAPQAAFASDDYPKKAVTIIVPVAPGGIADIVTRIAAERLSTRSGQSFTVEYVVGVGGSKGNQMVAKAAPDGYTLGLTTEALMLVNPHLYKNVTYTTDDFQPVGILAEMPLLLLVRQSHPAKTLTDFIALAREKPGFLTYGSSGAGTMPHLVGHQFAKAAGISLVHVPYRSGASSVTDLIGRRLDILAAGVTQVAGSIGKDGPLRPLAVAGAERLPAHPEVPTVAEAGVPGFALRKPWWGLVAPRGTPASVIDRLNDWLSLETMKQEEIQKLTATQLEPIFINAKGMAEKLAAEKPIWERAVREMGITLD